MDSVRKKIRLGTLCAAVLTLAVTPAASLDTRSKIIVTRDEIVGYGFRTLSDVIESVRGFYEIDDRNYGYVGARGILRPGDYGSRICLQVNGHRTNGNVYNAAAYGQGFGIDIDWIERVEIEYGPGEVRNGANASIAVVNVITRTPADAAGVRGKVEVGEEGYKKSAGTWGGELGKDVEVAASAAILDHNGQDFYFAEFDDPATNNGIASNVDGESGYSTLLQADHHKLEVFGVLNYRTKHIPTGSWGVVFNDSRNKTVDARNYVVLRYDARQEVGTGGRLELSYDHEGYTGDFIFDSGSGETTLNKDMGRGDWVTGRADWTAQAGAHTVMVGADAEWNIRTLQQNYDEPTPEVLYVDNHQNVTASGAFVSDEIDLGERVRATIGARLDHYSSVGTHVSPQAALAVAATDKSVTHARYYESFRSPRTYEIGFDDGAPNPDLQGEVFRTFEVDWEVELAPGLRGSATGYYSRIDGMILLGKLSDGSLQFQNVDFLDARGIELELRGRVASSVHAYGSIAFQETESSAGKILTNSPKRLYQAGLTFPTPRELGSLWLRVRGMSSRLTLAGDRVPAHVVTSVGVSSNPRNWGGLQVSLLVDNVFDTSYADPANHEHVMDTIEQSDRSVWVRLGYAWSAGR